MRNNHRHNHNNDNAGHAPMEDGAQPRINNRQARRHNNNDSSSSNSSSNGSGSSGSSNRSNINNNEGQLVEFSFPPNNIANNHENENVHPNVMQQNGGHHQNDAGPSNHGPPVIKRRRIGLSLIELWLHAVQRCELDQSYKAFIPSNLEEYHDLCMNPEALEATQKNLFDFLWGETLQGEFRDRFQPMVLHLFFMLEKFPFVLIQDTHLHFRATDMRQFTYLIDLFQLPPQLQHLNEQWDYFADIMCNQLNNVEESRAILPTYNLWRQTIRSLIDDLARLYQRDESSVAPGFQPDSLLVLVDRYAKTTTPKWRYSLQKMEQIQQLQNSKYAPWCGKHNYLECIWEAAVVEFLSSNSQEEESPSSGPWDLAAMGVPATVQDMQRLLLLDGDEREARAQSFFSGIFDKLPNHRQLQRRFYDFNMTTDDYVAFLKFFFHLNHDKFEIFRNTRSYLPTHVLINGAIVKQSVANHCLSGHIPQDSLVHQIDVGALYDARLMPFQFSSLLELYRGILPDQFVAPEDAGRVATAIAHLEALVLPPDQRAEGGDDTTTNHGA